jgi:hypothetical protein
LSDRPQGAALLVALKPGRVRNIDPGGRWRPRVWRPGPSPQRCSGGRRRRSLHNCSAIRAHPLCPGRGSVSLRCGHGRPVLGPTRCASGWDVLTAELDQPGATPSQAAHDRTAAIARGGRCATGEGRAGAAQRSWGHRAECSCATRSRPGRGSACSNAHIGFACRELCGCATCWSLSRGCSIDGSDLRVQRPASRARQLPNC